MNVLESLKATGALKIERINSAGDIVETLEVPNLVVTVGKNFIASSMLKTTTNSPAAMTHMAIGSDQTAAAAANTTLGVELGRVALSASTVSANAVTYTATFPAGTGTGDVKEAGIFNASSAGTMLCRTTFPIVTKQSGDSIAITWVVTVN